MMKTTGTIVVHVLSGPTRQMLRRSMDEEGAKSSARIASKALASITRCYIFRSMLQHDRREFQRLKLAKPILALTGMEGSANALILDIGMAGAYLEHYGLTEPGRTFHLTFRWQGHDVEFLCEVVRTSVVRQPAGDGKSQLSHTGVHFTEAIGDSATRLQDLIATFVGRILVAQRANAAGEENHQQSAMILESLGAARRKRSRGFVSYRLRDARWWRVPTESPVQPEDGFTVADWEDEAELEQLCRTYEASDDEGRQLIRLVAELSVNSISI
jgi:hypothetical protein